MKLFGGPRRLPATSYGYDPPADAVADGWACVDGESCGQTGDPAPRRWPHRCEGCDGPTDPLFWRDPWKTEARLIELPVLIERNPGVSFYRVELATLRYRIGVGDGDPGAARQARAEIHAIDEANRPDTWCQPGSSYWQIVHAATDLGRLDDAADDLDRWLAGSDTQNVETDNERRTNARMVIDAAARFLEAPGGATHPRAAEIRAACLAIAADAYPILNNDQQAAVNRISSGR